MQSLLEGKEFATEWTMKHLFRIRQNIDQLFFTRKIIYQEYLNIISFIHLPISAVLKNMDSETKTPRL